jgi:hypothetical protein
VERNTFLDELEVELVKTTTLLKLVEPMDPEETGVIAFAHETDAEETVPQDARSYSMGFEDWLEMGQPVEITVTVMPGDRLNEVEEEEPEDLEEESGNDDAD